MPRALRSTLLFAGITLLSACAPRAAEKAPPGDSAPASAPPPPADPEPAQTAPAQRDPLAIFLEAAGSDLARPYPASLPDAKARYLLLARALFPDTAGGWGTASIVASVLARSDDPRAQRALVGWASDKATSNDNRPEVLAQMRARPRAEYLAAVEAILRTPELASAIVTTSSGAYAAALGVGAKVSVQVTALELAASLPGAEGRALLVRLAEDRSATAPNPATLAAITCDPGQKRIEAEAEAVASLRLMALSALDDRALMAKIAGDPREPALARAWAARMLKGKPAVPDARAARTRRGPPGEEPVPMPWLAPSPCP